MKPTPIEQFLLFVAYKNISKEGLHPKKILIRLIPGLLTIGLITGCDQDNSPTSHTFIASPSTSAIATTLDDPCVMVLMPSAIKENGAASSIDKSIMRIQKAVSGASRPLPRLDRLGWTFVEKARETRDTGYYKLAEQTALCIETHAPNSAEALLLKGHVLHNLHRFGEAETLARRLVKQRGMWIDFALLGDVLMERGSLKEAIDAYQVVLDQRPGPRAYARVAQLRWLKGDLDGALEMMSKAARATSPRNLEAAAWVHVRLALMLIQVGEFPVADQVLAYALSLKPGYPPALHTRGRLLLAQNRPNEALPLLKQVVGSDPLPEFRWTLYEALREVYQHDAAGKQETVLKQYGAIEDPRTLALFLATTGSSPEMAVHLALQELEQRKDVFTLDAVAWALSSAGFNDKAVDYSRRALAEGTQDARIYLHGGVIAARVGDSALALKLLNKAKLIQHMLLPSERQLLSNGFAVIHPQVSGDPTYRTNLSL